MQGIKRFLHDYARWIAAALAVVCLGLVAYYMTTTRQVRKTSAVCTRNEVTNLGDGDVLEQMLVLSEEDLQMEQAKISVLVATYQNRFHSGVLTMQLLEENGQPVKNATVNCAEISDNESVTLDTEGLAPGYLYVLRIALTDFHDTTGLVGIWTGMAGEEEDSAQSEETRAMGQATKNAQPLTDTEDEYVYATVKGFERETGIQRAYYYLCGALIIGAVFFLLPSQSQEKQGGKH